MTDDRPGPPQTPQEWLAEVRRYERQAELFRAYDIAMQGLAQHPDALALQHRAVLCLAATGATRQAEAKFAELGLDRTGASAADQRLRMDIKTLKARLAKDEALAQAGEERRARLRAAAALYREVFAEESAADNPEAYYPGINAASLHLLAGDRETAAELAGAVLKQLAPRPPERRDYYEHVSEIEALLVLGRLDEARTLAHALRGMLSTSETLDFRALASTLRQLRLVIAANRLDEAWLTGLSPPPVLHYVGHIISAPGQRGRFAAEEEAQVAAAIAKRIAGAGIRFAYGSLAAGADILFAEALLERGASLNIVLPFDREEFVEISVRPSGARWVERFERCLAAAEKTGTVRFATEDRYLGDDALFGYCSQLAMGLAILRGRHLAAEVEQIAVSDGTPPTGPAGTAADMAVWRRTGRPQSVISCGDGAAPPRVASASVRAFIRRPRAILFSDMRQFSALTDVELPRFVNIVLGSLARIIAGYGADVLLVETWGDGIYLVFDDAGKAARCALDLQKVMAGIDLAGAGLPTHLALRIGGHLGPVYSGRNPITGKPDFFGAHVTRAARIEPITPEGCVYVTETLAAVLALHNAAEFACDYVGMTETAKHYGRMRMFLLRRAAG